MTRPYMLRSKTTEYQTPPDLFDKLDEEFGPFDLDPCCRILHRSAGLILQGGGHVYVPSGEADFLPDDTDEPVGINGLVHPWHGRVYMNPPYSDVGKWVEKAVHEVECGNAELVVALLPARTDTKWWQRYVLPEVWWGTDDGRETTEPLGSGSTWHSWHGTRLTRVSFLPGRLKFAGAKNFAPFPSAIVIWRR